MTIKIAENHEPPPFAQIEAEMVRMAKAHPGVWRAFVAEQARESYKRTLQEHGMPSAWLQRANQEKP